jgi:predicted O-methyltransferase YrrM
MDDKNLITGCLNFGDSQLLCNAAKCIPKNGLYVEVGSFKGLSTAIVGKANNYINLVCIDIWHGPESYNDDRDKIHEIFIKNMESVEILDRIITYNMKSIKAVELIKDSSADMIFIDGSHEENDVYFDIKLYYPKLKKNGIFLVHDCVPETGVKNALDKFMSENNNLEYITYEPPHGWYMTLIKEKNA